MAQLRPYQPRRVSRRHMEKVRKRCLTNFCLAIAVPADGHVQRFAGHIFSAGLMNDRCCLCDRLVSDVLSGEIACGTDQPSDAQLAEIRAVKEQFLAAVSGISAPHRRASDDTDQPTTEP